jgi:hypothetical protein
MRAGYHTASFVFTKRETLDRPILGRVTRVQTSSVRATLITAAAPPETDEATVVKASAFRTWGDLARRLVELRRSGDEVAIEIE